jgi:hypothetical protein
VLAENAHREEKGEMWFRGFENGFSIPHASLLMFAGETEAPQGTSNARHVATLAGQRLGAGDFHTLAKSLGVANGYYHLDKSSGKPYTLAHLIF